MAEIIVRSILAYFTLFILTRIMGKREISQLTYFDYVVGITIGTLTGALITETKQNFVNILPALLIFTAFQLTIAYTSLHNPWLRRVFGGSKTILIEKGKILEKNMAKARINIEELSGKLREKNVFKLSDVEYAYLETTGKLSVMKKTSKQPLTAEDINLVKSYTGVGEIVIEDGRFKEDVLKNIGITKTWLMEKAKNQGVNDINDVMFCQIDESGNIFIDLVENK